MGKISIFNGKYLIPVPWKTGTYYSQSRLKEFIGSEGIKAELNKSKPPKSHTSIGHDAGSEESETIQSKGSLVLKKHPPFSNDLPNTHTKENNQITLKQLLPETVNYKWRKEAEREAKRKIREEELEKKRIHNIAFLSTKQLKSIKFKTLPQPSQPKKSEPPKPQVQTPPKPSIGTKMYNFVNSEQYKSLAKSLIMASVVLFLIGVLGGFTFIFVALTMPYYIVGFETTFEVPSTEPLNETQNNTPSYTAPTPPVPPSQVVVVTLPPVVTPPDTQPQQGGTSTNTSVNTSPEKLPPPPAPLGTTVMDDKGNTHDISDIPSKYRFQAPFSCYWELRDKGFGREFEAEYECNARGTGLWHEACLCCRQMYPDRC